jgi:competence protein ComEC
MRASIAFLLTLALSVVPALAQSSKAKTFDIYVIDVEGGNATLFVAPSGDSTLIDTGTGGTHFRDADRIMEAAKDAGLTHLDNLITTHWHHDHFGGMPDVASRIPVRNFIDHGPNTQARNAIADDFIKKTYLSLYAEAKHTVVKAGDTIPMRGLDWRIVSAAGETIKTPLPGAGSPNPACATFTSQPISDDDENPQSVGSVITFGKFRMVGAPGRSDVEQRVCLDVPHQPDWSPGSVDCFPSRTGTIGLASTGGRDPTPSGDHE